MRARSSLSEQQREQLVECFEQGMGCKQLPIPSGSPDTPCRVSTVGLCCVAGYVPWRNRQSSSTRSRSKRKLSSVTLLARQRWIGRFAGATDSPESTDRDINQDSLPRWFELFGNSEQLAGGASFIPTRRAGQRYCFRKV